MSNLPRVRLVPPLDEWPRVVRFAETSAGRVVLVAVFAAGLYLHHAEWWLAGATVLAVMSVWPERRRAVMVLAALWWGGQYARFPWSAVRRVAETEGVAAAVDWNVIEPSALALGLGASVLYHAVARARPTWGPLRRPIVTWIALYFALLAFAAYAPLSGEARVWAWAVASVVGRYLWFVAFSLLDRHTVEPRAPVRHLGHWLPFWMAATHAAPPIPKGSAYLRRIEAKDLSELAITQLKGVKLLWWAGVLVVLKQLLEWTFFGTPEMVPSELGLTATFGLPVYAAVFDGHLAGTAAPLHVAWASLAGRFLVNLLRLAIWGHVIVATCRMAGFRALRNTYRPLESRTIAEFWNRYYYYFKELLVEVFFYPTFLRFFKGRPRLRVFVATLAAAGGGNVLYHYLQEVHRLTSRGPLLALWEFRAYAVYGVLLGTAIGISQLRTKARAAPRGWFSRRVLAPFSVLAFYCVLSVFDAPLRSPAITDHVTFLMSLVGL